MKKGRKLTAFLLALVLVLGLGIPAAADERSGTDTGMVAVKVENVEGGALRVWYYDEAGARRYLPIGEDVQIPRGTELIMSGGEDSFEFYVKKYDTYAVSTLKNVRLISKSGTRFFYDESNSDDEWEQTAVITENTQIQPEFDPHYVIEGEGVGGTGESRLWIRSGSVSYPSASVVNMDLRVIKGGKKVPFTEIKQIEIVEGRAYGSRGEQIEFDPDWFEFTETGLKSTEKLPLGYYKINMEYENGKDGRTGLTTARIFIGKTANASYDLAKYRNDESGDWDIVEGDLMGVHNPENGEVYFDAAVTSVGDIVSYLNTPQEEYDGIIPPAGYQSTGVWRDAAGKIVTENTTTLLKDTGKRRSVTIYPEMKKGAKTFEPAIVKMPDADKIRVIYQDSWYQKNGKWYYNDYEGNLVKNQWQDKGGEPAFCGSDGALVTDGIAGVSLEDEEGLWLVDKNGRRMEDYSDTKVIGMLEYVIEEGQVVSYQKVAVKTPSNAELKDFTESLEISKELLTEEELLDAADKLSEGITTLSASDKKKLDESQIQKVDSLLMEIYGITPEAELEIDDAVEEGMALNGGETRFVGLAAAAGLDSSKLTGAEIKIKIKQKKTASASNATREILRFDAALYVNGSKRQLKCPVYMYVGIPDDVLKKYPPKQWNYTGIHIPDGGKEEKFTPAFTEDGEYLVQRADSFSEFRISVKKKSSPGSGSSSSSGGGSSYSTKKRVSAQTRSGQWLQDAAGWWFQFEDGTYPKNQWVQLQWGQEVYWYYFDQNGYMATGWLKDGGNWYYLHPVGDGSRGYMYTGWHEIDGKWYYFNQNDGGPRGSMAVDTVTPDGHRVDANGVWIQ